MSYSEVTTPAAYTIAVSLTDTIEVAADYADLFIVVQGTSLFTGSAALSKAREIAQLVHDLQANGVAEEDIHLHGVKADVHTGALGNRGSSATYKLKVRVRDLAHFGDVLGAVTGQKNTTLQNIGWGYSDIAYDEAAHLDKTIRRAGEKARRIAAGLGVRLLGVYSYCGTLTDSVAGIRPPGFAAEIPSFARAKATTESLRVTDEDLGLEVTHSKTMKLLVEVMYHTSGMEASAVGGG